MTEPVPSVTSDASPLIALAWLEHLHLLPTLFQRVAVPTAVHHELTRRPHAVGAASFATAPWLQVLPVQNRLAVTLLREQLDLGESEAIVLAHEQQAEILLLDERRGRRRASQSGLTVLGTLGILLRAHELGLVERVQPLLDHLLLLPFRMSDALYTEVLRRAEEA